MYASPFPRLSATNRARLALITSLLPVVLCQAQQPRLDDADTETVELSPFVVSTQHDSGYRAANTLGGTRLNTNLMETPAAISVLTKELLDDLGAVNTADVLRFATGASFDEGNDQNANGSQWYDAPARIRGFGGATVTRDYFPWAMTSDSFNVERVDVSRGPNAVLFGIGTPGGVVNTTSKQAMLNSRKNRAAITVGSWNQRRGELDLNFPLIRDTLALRVNTVLEDKDGEREFEFLKQKGLALAATYRPFKNSYLRAGVERRVVDQLRAPQTARDLGGTRWLAAGAPLAGNPLMPGSNPLPGIVRTRNIEQVMYAPQLRATPFRMSTIGADMRPDLAGNQASGFWDTVPGAGTLAQGQVNDPYLGSLVPLAANLPGPGQTTNFNNTVASLYFEQKIGNLSVELAYRNLQLWRDNRTTSVTGLIGDPNPVLPGAYYADADSRVAAGRLPGTLLPDIGAPNPEVGGVYVEGQAQTRPFDWDQNQYRATLSYDLDLTRRRWWLGHHAIAAMGQRDRSYSSTWVEREYNLAPNNNQLIDSTTNSIIRRTYIDFSDPEGVHGAFDPWAHPIDVPGVKSSFAIVGLAGKRRIQTDSSMVATQSKFFHDRVIVTAGYRRDELKDWRPIEESGIRMPNSTNLYLRRSNLLGPAEEFQGDTSTFGTVVFPVRWLGLSYNQSNSVNPQTAPNPYDQPYGVRRGTGRDFGIRLNLLRGRLYFTANAYETRDENQQTNVFVAQQQAMNASVPAILDTLKITGQALPASMAAAGVTEWTGGNGHTVDQDGRGVECELIGTITRGWNVSLNFSRNKLGLSNIAPFHNAFIAEVTPAWKGNLTPLDATPARVATYVSTRDNTPGRDFTLNPATINDAYEDAALQVAQINRANGQRPMQNQEYSANVFTSYRFRGDAPGVLKNARAGVGANYRSAPVIGYYAAENNAPILGRHEFLMNAMLGKSLRIGKGRAFDLQINFQNLLGEEDLLPFNASVPGQILVSRYPRVMRSWTLRIAYDF